MHTYQVKKNRFQYYRWTNLRFSHKNTLIGNCAGESGHFDTMPQRYKPKPGTKRRDIIAAKTQPLDVAFFRPMKTHWRQTLTKWKEGAGRNATALPKHQFPQLLSATLTSMESKSASNILSGFGKCGIIPLCRDKVLKRLPIENTDADTAGVTSALDQSFATILHLLHPRTDPDKIQRKSKLNVQPGKSVSKEDLSKRDECEATTSTPTAPASNQQPARRSARISSHAFSIECYAESSDSDWEHSFYA